MGTVLAMGWMTLVQANGMKAPTLAPTPSKRAPSSSQQRSIWVTRPTGAISCEPGSGESPEKAGQDLARANIQVLQYKAASDGLIHLPMCGAPQGGSNAYLISESDKPQALALGFKMLEE